MSRAVTPAVSRVVPARRALRLRLRPRVLVSGCFDLLHSGHVAFLEEAATHGDLYVAIGLDRTVVQLKGRPPVNDENERLYLVRSLRCVHEAFISSGAGVCDFRPELQRVRPDIFFVNADGDTQLKRQTIEACGIRYVVSRRLPSDGLPRRSTTALRQLTTMPFRLDLAGGWLDQPFVSQHHPGAVINCCIEPSDDFQTRSGLASSTRAAAMRLWGPRLPAAADREQLARTLFAVENPPGTVNVSGSQDTIGVVYPGVNRSDYAGGYWPAKITNTLDPVVLEFLETHVQLLATDPRAPGTEVLNDTRIDRAGAARLAEAADACWDALLSMDAPAFADAVTASFDAQVAMFPNMLTPGLRRAIDHHRGQTLGYKIAGAGGGGYLVLAAEKPIEGARRITVQRDK
jgi:cytidyltransferase-like protein